MAAMVRKEVTRNRGEPADVLPFQVPGSSAVGRIRAVIVWGETPVACGRVQGCIFLGGRGAKSIRFDAQSIVHPSMSQEVSKWLVNGLVHPNIQIPFISR